MSNDKLVETLRKASTAIYIATDEETAKQISITFMRAANRIAELEAIIKAAPHKWVSVKEAYPSAADWYLIVVDEDDAVYCAVAFYFVGETYASWIDNSVNPDLITHWMPLPKTPQEIEYREYAKTVAGEQAQ